MLEVGDEEEANYHSCANRYQYPYLYCCLCFTLSLSFTLYLLQLLKCCIKRIYEYQYLICAMVLSGTWLSCDVER